jgi:hypothetical protein
VDSGAFGSDEGAAHSSGGLVGLPCEATASPLRIQRGDAVSPDDDAPVKAAKVAAGRRRWQCSKGLECCSLFVNFITTSLFSDLDWDVRRPKQLRYVSSLNKIQPVHLVSNLGFFYSFAQT